MAKIYISTSFDKEANWACATRNAMVSPEVKPYATIETEHLEMLLDWYDNWTKTTAGEGDKVVDGVTFHGMGPDQVINFIRATLWSSFHEQGIVTLDANREHYKCALSIVPGRE